METDRRQARKEIGFLQSESVWLQKALFALRKAEAARESLADARSEALEPYSLPVGGRDVLVEELDKALDERVESLVQTVRTMRRNLY